MVARWRHRSATMQQWSHQRLEEVAMDVGVLQHRLVEKRLKVEAGLVAVDLRMAVQRQNGADVRVLEFD
jgi:hypothetical protein